MSVGSIICTVIGLALWATGIALTVYSVRRFKRPDGTQLIPLPWRVNILVAFIAGTVLIVNYTSWFHSTGAGRFVRL